MGSLKDISNLNAIEVEFPAKDIAECSQSENVALMESMRKGRSDISLWRRRQSELYPYALIEVKRNWQYNNSSNRMDYLRLLNFLKFYGKTSGGTIRSGYFVQLSSVWTEKDQNSALEAAEDRGKNIKRAFQRMCEADSFAKMDFKIENAVESGLWYENGPSQILIFATTIKASVR